MSAPSSSTASPRSSNLTVPATQNTAPVIKFRCLYTHDLRRKAKRWQDGFLRYHSFNKRVMVYDNGGYFIGDLHWRQDEGIQDGDELELDKGVLIQVCEPMERTETDISSLYSKNTSQGSPSRSGNLSTPSVRSVAPVRSSVASQQPSRSLKDLLGIKKTTTGQLLSPSEERRGQEQPERSQRIHERPAKRQRAASPTHASRPNGPQSTIIDLSGSPPAEDADLLGLPPSSQVGLSRDNPYFQSSMTTTSSNLISQDKTRTENPTTPQNIENPLSAPQKPVPIDSGSETSVNILRLASEKPRRKLMYQALPPSRGSTDAFPKVQSQSQGIPPAARARERTDATYSNSSIVILDESEDELSLDQSRGSNPISKRQELPSSNVLGKSTVMTSAGSTPSCVATGHQQQTSRNDATTSAEQVFSAPAASVKPVPPKQLIPNKALPNTHNDGKLPMKLRSTGLRKSYSDPSAMNSLQVRPLSSSTTPLNPLEEKNAVHEQGPWTPEALDLFEFWPPGRPKPG